MISYIKVPSDEIIKRTKRIYIKFDSKNLNNYQRSYRYLVLLIHQVWDAWDKLGKWRNKVKLIKKERSRLFQVIPEVTVTLTIFSIKLLYIDISNQSFSYRLISSFFSVQSLYDYILSFIFTSLHCNIKSIQYQKLLIRASYRVKQNMI